MKGMSGLKPVLIFILLIIYLFTNGCDNCRNDECPGNEIFITFEVFDSLGVNCASINPDLETFLLSSNENDKDIVRAINQGFLLQISADVSSYILKLNETEFVTIDLTRTTMISECCGQEYELMSNYELLQQGMTSPICTNCKFFDLIRPNCE